MYNYICVVYECVNIPVLWKVLYITFPNSTWWGYGCIHETITTHNTIKDKPYNHVTDKQISITCATFSSMLFYKKIIVIPLLGYTVTRIYDIPRILFVHVFYFLWGVTIVTVVYHLREDLSRMCTLR